MKQFQTRGIILRRIDYGEADRIMTFLTEDNGKLRAIAKGVRKQKSKLAGGIELFSVSEIQFIKGKGDIDTLVSTRLITHYGAIVKDLARTDLAYKLLKIIDKTVEDTAGQEYFAVLNESLAALNNDKVPLVLAECSMYMRVMQLLGQVPQFSLDPKGYALDPEAHYEFDFESVAFVARSNAPFDKNHVKVIKLLAHNTPQSLAAVKGIEGFCADLLPLVRGLAGYYIPS